MLFRKVRVAACVACNDAISSRRNVLGHAAIQLGPPLRFEERGGKGSWSS